MVTLRGERFEERHRLFSMAGTHRCFALQSLALAPL